jgi:IS30 family transposase
LGVATTVSYLTGEPPTSRKYTQEQKDEFFAVFDRLKSTREAARELGLNPDTRAGWVRRAGLKSHGKPGRALTGDGRSTPGCAILT